MDERRRSRARRRARSRGAAMVEGIVVITTKLVFLGLVVFVGTAYVKKIDQLGTTRRDVLFYASHGCRGGGADGAEGGDPGAVGAFGGEADAFGEEVVGSEEAIDKGLAPLPRERSEHAAVSRSWNTARASRETVATGSSILNRGPGIALERNALEVRVRTTSEVACNEQVYDDPWTAVPRFAVDYVKGGGGVL